MARIDSLISTLVESGIPLAAVQPDRPVMLDMGGGDTRELSDRAITAKQVEMLVQEVASDEDWDSLRKVGRVEFDYEAPSQVIEEPQRSVSLSSNDIWMLDDAGVVRRTSGESQALSMVGTIPGIRPVSP